MEITDVRIKTVENGTGKLKAFATITIDECFVVHDIRLVEGKDGCFISMPGKKTPDGEHRDIVHPINQETRTKISDAVIAAYENAKNQAE